MLINACMSMAPSESCSPNFMLPTILEFRQYVRSLFKALSYVFLSTNATMPGDLKECYNICAYKTCVSVNLCIHVWHCTCALYVY